jgi:hypothetical protein
MEAPASSPPFQRTIILDDDDASMDGPPPAPAPVEAEPNEATEPVVVEEPQPIVEPVAAPAPTVAVSSHPHSRRPSLSVNIPLAEPADAQDGLYDAFSDDGPDPNVLIVLQQALEEVSELDVIIQSAEAVIEHSTFQESLAEPLAVGHVTSPPRTVLVPPVPVPEAPVFLQEGSQPPLLVMQSGVGPDTGAGVVVSPTAGLAPGLIPVFGNEVVVREIHVENEDEEVDVVTEDDVPVKLSPQPMVIVSEERSSGSNGNNTPAIVPEALATVVETCTLETVTAVTESGVVDVMLVSEPAASVDEAALLMALSTSQPAAVVVADEPNPPAAREEAADHEAAVQVVKEKPAKRVRKRSRPVVELRTRMGRVTFTQTGVPIIVHQPVLLSEPFGMLCVLLQCLVCAHLCVGPLCFQCRLRHTFKRVPSVHLSTRPNPTNFPHSVCLMLPSNVWLSQAFVCVKLYAMAPASM